MMDLYFKTMKLNKNHVYLCELKGHTKHLNIFISKADVFIRVPHHPPPPQCQVLVSPLNKWEFKMEVETHEVDV